MPAGPLACSLRPGGLRQEPPCRLRSPSIRTRDAANREKHGLSLAEAQAFDWAHALTLVDDRKDYGEPRYRSYAMLHGRLHMAAWTPRGPVIRMISLRRANRREARRYAER